MNEISVIQAELNKKNKDMRIAHGQCAVCGRDTTMCICITSCPMDSTERMYSE